MRKQGRKPKNRLKGRTFTQEDALRFLQSSTKQGLGVFSSNADENIAAPPDRVYLLMWIPGQKFLPWLTLRNPDMAKQLIEDLITHRRNVWPDAEEIDTEGVLEDDDAYNLET